MYVCYMERPIVSTFSDPPTVQQMCQYVYINTFLVGLSNNKGKGIPT